MNEEKKVPYYAGEEFARLSFHDGGLRHVVGASNYQVTRANRSHPEYAGGFYHTYNHAPMITYWKNHYYVQHLCNEVSEHTGGGMSIVSRSSNGINWETPKVSFPIIKVPAGTYKCTNGAVIEVPEEKEAYMHQRMGFFQSRSGRLLISGFYGHTPYHDLCPWQNYGMGRVIREIFEDGSMGDIYFIRYLDYSGWTEDKLPFPVYTKSNDKGFIEACKELLNNKLVTQQWAEEHGDEDPYVTFKSYQVHGEVDNNGVCANSPFESASSFCWYYISEETVIGLWKQSKVGRSDDGGETWICVEEPSFATSGAKSWGQKTNDDKYAIAYVNSLSSEHRYPLVVVTSEDGFKYDNMACAFGEVPPRRYEGLYKDFGPQYIRGIEGGDVEFPQDAMWLCHSVNKEDIFVTRLPVPIVRSVKEHVNDDFSNSDDYVHNWNIYSPLWAPIRAFTLHDGTTCLRIADKDPCDYARAMRIFPASKHIRVTFDFMSAASYEENLEVELTDHTGIVGCRVLIGNNKVVVRYASDLVFGFELPTNVGWHNLQITADCARNRYIVVCDNQHNASIEKNCRMVHKVNTLERLVIRTKPLRYLPNNEILPLSPDMNNVDEPVKERIYYITNVKTEEV